MATATETLEGYVVDIACLRRYPQDQMLERARVHSQACAMMGHCLESGYGLVQKDGRVVLLDAHATPRVLMALQHAQERDGFKLRVRREQNGHDMQTVTVELCSPTDKTTAVPQPVPVRIYQVEDRIMLAAPLPGVEPDNITVTITGSRVKIRAEERGPGQHTRHLVVAEWTIGRYEREVVLPQPVSAALTNATYDNGVLVVVMPKLTAGQPLDHEELHLHPLRATRGERVGHSGSTITPLGTAMHRRKHQETQHPDPAVQTVAMEADAGSHLC